MLLNVNIAKLSGSDSRKGMVEISFGWQGLDPVLGQREKSFVELIPLEIVTHKGDVRVPSVMVYSANTRMINRLFQNIAAKVLHLKVHGGYFYELLSRQRSYLKGAAIHTDCVNNKTICENIKLWWVSVGGPKHTDQYLVKNRKREIMNSLNKTDSSLDKQADTSACKTSLIFDVKSII